MEVSVQFVEGMTFLGLGGSNHYVVMEGAPEAGGRNAGPRPMELLLMALGGCTGMDVVSILRKRRISVKDFRMVLRGERRDEHPRKFTRIEIEYIFRGDGLEAHEKAIRDTVALSQDKYCSVAASLRPQVEITYRITLLPAGEETPTPGNSSS
ncbi:MAG: OsmC family protein [Limnochordales bacterium]|nr:OsmC family protein [Limnochordales bacterium]